MPIYEKTTRDLMHDFAAEKLRPGQAFAKQDAASWFAAHYPKIKRITVMMHVEAMSVNSKSRKHHPNVKPDLGWDLFFRLGPKAFRLWDPDKDPAPIYKADIEAAEEDGLAEDAAEIDDDEDDIDDAGEGSRQFAFERDLQYYLVNNLPLLEPGLGLYKDEDGQFDGIEFPAGRRRIDILAVGSDGALVVIETKVSRAYDKVVGQTLHYMAWVKKNLADDKPVRGIIVGSEITNDLKLAASLVENVRLVEYEISFSLKSV